MDTHFLDKDTDRLNQIDREGAITEEDKKRFPGIHFCPDWDFLAVCDKSSEIDGCTCKKHPRGYTVKK